MNQAMRMIVGVGTGAILVLSSTASAQKKVTLKSGLDSLSYVIGRDVGQQLKKFGAKLEVSQFAAGVEHELNGVVSQIDSMRADSIRQAFALEVQGRMEREQQQLASQQDSIGKQFLAQNKKRQGVRTSASGLQYQVLQEGKGASPKAGDSVRIHYRGMLSDSTVFDSTLANEPVVLSLDRTIPGLSEGIMMMKVGSRYRFFVPPNLGYGPAGVPPDIPPNAVLIFEVELLGIGGNAGLSRSQPDVNQRLLQTMSGRNK